MEPKVDDCCAGMHHGIAASVRAFNPPTPLHFEVGERSTAVRVGNHNQSSSGRHITLTASVVTFLE